MKKILFLLLCTVSIYGQTSTGQEQEFDYGIKNNALQTITTPTYIGTFGTDGTQGKIPSAYIAKTQAVQDSLNKKLNISDLPTNLTLYPTTTASDVGGYVVMVTDIHDVRYNDTAVDVTTPAITTTDQLVSQRISDAGVLIGQPGVFNVTTFGNIRRLSGTGTASFYFRVYHRDAAGVETLIGQSSNSAVVSSSSYMEFSASMVWDDGDFFATDRIVIKTYANRVPGNSDPVYQFQFGGTQPVRTLLAVPFSVVNSGFVKTIGNENISGVKTFQNTGIVGANLIVKNLDATNRDNYMTFSNASGDWDLGLKDLSGTLFQLKTGGVAAWNIDRTTGKMYVGLNASQPYFTMQVKDNSTGGDTSFLIQAGQTQTSNFITTKYNNNVDAFIVDKDANILYNKNLNKMIVISGDSFSNDVSQFGVAGDFPTYFLYGQKNHDWKHVVTAVAGRTVATMLANYTAEITPYARNYEHQERMLMLYGGINDMFASRTATATYNDLKSMWANAKAQGFTVIAYTICSATTLTAPQEAERVSLNTMILSDRSLYDYVVEAAVLFPDPANTLFFNVDGTHLNTNGAEYLGKKTYEYVYNDYLAVQPTQAINIGTGKNLVTDSGIKATSFIKTGGTSSQFLKADGSVDSSTYHTGTLTTNYIPKATGSSTLGNSIITESSGKIGVNKVTPTKGFHLGATDGNGGFYAEYTDNGVVTGNIFEIKSLLNGKSFYVDRGGSAVFQNVLKVDLGGIVLGANGFSSLDVNGTNGTKLYGAAGIDLYTITNSQAFHVTQSGRTLINTATDDGSNFLQVNGSTKTTALTLSTAPTTSAGTYDILTRNTSTGVVEKITDTRPYKIYVAILNQVGTSAPTATILENTLGGTVVWTRGGTGAYTATLSGAFVSAKTTVLVSNGAINGKNSTAGRFSNNEVSLSTYGFTALEDTAMVDGTIEIRVYN